MKFIDLMSKKVQEIHPKTDTFTMYVDESLKGYNEYLFVFPVIRDTILSLNGEYEIVNFEISEDLNLEFRTYLVTDQVEVIFKHPEEKEFSGSFLIKEGEVIFPST